MSSPVHPTIAAAQAAARAWDVVIIGAGPAGSVAALLLARGGAQVLLLDRRSFPRFKVCGCCIHPAGLELLGALGLGHALRAAGELQTFCWGAAGRQARIRLPGGVALSRERLDGLLISAAIAAGAEFLPEATARVRPLADDRQRRVALHAGTAGFAGELRARLVFAADGLNGGALDELPEMQAAVRADTFIGMATRLEDAPGFAARTIHMACAAGGYAGVVQLENGRWDVAAAVDPRTCRAAGGPGPFIESVLGEAGFPRLAGLRAARWHGTPALSRRRPPAAARLLCVGDCAGYIEPFTGDGITWALLGARAAAQAALRGLQAESAGAAAALQEAIPREWRARHQRLVASRRLGTRLLTAALRWRPLAEAAVALAGRFPSPAAGALRFATAAPWSALRELRSADWPGGGETAVSDARHELAGSGAP